MSSGGVSAVPNMMDTNLLRRKLGLISVGGPVRCLFGTPDPEECREVVRKVEAVRAWAFSKRWNFNITGNPEPPATVESNTELQQKYEWLESYDENYMAKCDRHRFEVPIAPNARPVTLLYAPTCMPKEPDHVPEKLVTSSIESVSVQTEKEVQVHQGTQVERKEVLMNKTSKCELTLNLVSVSLQMKQADHLSDRAVVEPESMCSPPVLVPVQQQQRRLPAPLTIPPISPDRCQEEHEDMDDHDESFDETYSPFPGQTISSKLSILSPTESHRTPTKRRHSDGVFSFPPFLSPSSGMRFLRIRNGSPVHPQSNMKIFRQRSITEYMEVKKAKVTKGKKIQ